MENIIVYQAKKIAELEKQLQEVRNKSTVKFVEYLKDWLALQTHLAPNTRNTYKSEYKQHLKPYFSKNDYCIHEITPEIIERFYAEKIGSGLSPNFVIRLHAFLFSAFKHAERHGVIGSNPMNRVKRPKENQFIASWYDTEQIMTLLDRTVGHKLFVPILIAALLGLRRSEIVGLKWSSINFSNGLISIREKAVSVKGRDIDMKKMKSQASYRTLILPPVLLQMLSKIKETQNAVKPFVAIELRQNFKYVCIDIVDRKGERLTTGQITNGFIRLIDKLEMPTIRFHDLRHSCATFLLHNGCNMKQVQAWLGHSSYNTTAKYYTHVDIRDKEQAAEAINMLFATLQEICTNNIGESKNDCNNSK